MSRGEGRIDKWRLKGGVSLRKEPNFAEDVAALKDETLKLNH